MDKKNREKVIKNKIYQDRYFFVDRLKLIKNIMWFF